MDELSTITGVHAATSMILWSINKNGLEKTLEDLRKNCCYESKVNIDNNQPCQGAYTGFLGTLRIADSLLATKGVKVR